MANYSVQDLVGKTLAVKNGIVNYYKYPARRGEKKDNPVGQFTGGDLFVPYSWINKAGTYTNFDDNYYQVKRADGTYIYVPFAEMAGKYDVSYVSSQGIKSIEQKQQEAKEKEEGFLMTMVKRYVPIVIGGALLIGFLTRRR